MSKLYYTAPPDEAFIEMRGAAMDVWGQYKDSPGDYMEEKLSRIRDIHNVSDNFMYIFAMFDMDNQYKVVEKLSENTKLELKKRLIDGGNGESYCLMVGL